MPLYRLTPPGELVEVDSVRDEGRAVALIGTARSAGDRVGPRAARR